ncbi:MAG: YdcF family protein [Ilumatobacteraceae bacterium]
MSDGEGSGRRSGRRILVVAGALGALLLGWFVVTWVQVARVGADHDAGPVDAIVVMGAAQYDGRPSPQLAARLDHVVTLWSEGVAPVVVVTGGRRPGDRFTEAEASSRYLVDAGVPVDSIVEVGAGASTFESVAAARPLMEDLGIGSVAMVTDPYHALRARLILSDAGFEVDVASTPVSVVSGWTARRREVVEAAGVMIGRVIGFDRLTELAG